MVAGAQQPKHGIDRGHSRGEDVGGLSAFQASDATLEGAAVRVCCARVVVAFILAQLLLHVCRGLKNRRDDSARSRFRLLSNVDRVGGESHAVFLLRRRGTPRASTARHALGKHNDQHSSLTQTIGWSLANLLWVE